MSYASEVLADSPLIYWKLDQAAGSGAAVDSSGNGLTSSPNFLGVYGAPGLVDAGAAMSCNGNNQGVSSNGNVAALRLTAGASRSVELWVSTTQTTQGCLAQTGGGSGRLDVKINRVAGKVSVWWGQTAGTYLDSTATVNDGLPHHIVATISGTTVTLYVDGVAQGTMARATSNSSDPNLVHGYDTGLAADLTGTLDEIAWYTTELSAARVAAHYAAAAPIPSVTAASTLSASGSAAARASAAATTALAVAASAVVVVATSAVTTLGVQSEASAYAVGEAIPVTADTTLAVTSSASVSPVIAAEAATVLAVSSSAASLEVHVVTASTALSVTTGASAALGAAASGTVTTSREGGRTREGLAVATWTPAVVAPPGVMMSGDHRRIRATAFGPVTMNGTRPTYDVSEATAPRLRTRILVGGKDISFLRGVATPEPDYQLAEPLLWGPCDIELPQVSAAFEVAGQGALSWCAKGKPVVLQRVTEAGVVVDGDVDYRGLVIGHDTSGKSLRLEVGGHAQGRAALRHKPLPIFRDTPDLGRLAWASIRDLGLRFEPRLGPKTGMKQALFGGTDHLSYISQLCAKAFDRDGQWSLMPDADGTYRFARKDTTTVHWTLFNDDTRVVAQLRSDAAEEPNRIFASGTTPKGQRVRFGVYPGLKAGDPPPYPFDDDRTFGLGTEDDDTDTGDGVFVMVRKMWTSGYLSLEDASGDYDQDVTRALMSLQEEAGLSATGNMNPATWDALFDVDVTGYTLRGSRVEPAAQDYRVRRYNRSASDQVIEKNPNFDRHRLIVDRDIDYGAGFTRHRMREFSRAEVYRGDDNWVGTITITTGAVLRGDVPVGATITAADLADVRDIRPGQNARLPLFGGGILVHIAGVEITRTDGGHAVARLTVDTQARDAMPVWEMIRRNRETRRDAARRWTGNRASSQVKDSVDVWDEVGGVLYDDIDLQPGWNVIPVVAGQEGTVSRLRLVVQDLNIVDTDIAVQGREFACAVFGKKVTPKRLRTLIGNPLAASKDSTSDPSEEDVDPPTTDPEADGGDPGGNVTPGRPWWERKANVDALRDLDLLYSAGTYEEPCGYSPGKKSNGGTKTGLHRDDAGFSYRTRSEPVLYIAVWVWGERTLTGGRVMWPQLEAGA